MILRAFSDVSDLSVSKSRSRIADYFYLSSSMPSDTTSGVLNLSVTPILTPKLDLSPPLNGTVHVLYHILTRVMSSRLKLEQYFKNYQTCLSMCTVLQKTGYPHTLTPIEVDNQCAVSILANTVRQRLSKSIYIRFFWARDRIRQDQFCVYWRPDKNDRADYFNKYHAPLRYKEMCSIYLVIFLSN